MAARALAATAAVVQQCPNRNSRIHVRCSPSTSSSAHCSCKHGSEKSKKSVTTHTYDGWMPPGPDGAPGAPTIEATWLCGKDSLSNCVYIYACIYTWRERCAEKTYTYTHTHLSVCVYIYMPASRTTYTYTYTCVHTSTYPCMNACMHACIYIDS